MAIIKRNRVTFDIGDQLVCRSKLLDIVCVSAQRSNSERIAQHWSNHTTCCLMKVFVVVLPCCQNITWS